MIKSILLLSAALLAPATAFAATLNVVPFDSGSYPAAGRDLVGAEDLQTLGTSNGNAEVGGSLMTGVGTFSTLGGTGSGGTVRELAGNTGQQLALRNQSVFGREALPPAGGPRFLDSNDTFGISWDIGLADGALFDRVVFTLQDASDVGAFTRIMSGIDSFEMRTDGRLANNNAVTVELLFGMAVSSANVTIANYTTLGGSEYFLNDGFSIGGFQAFNSARVPIVDGGVSEVPLPASVWLLVAALAGAGAVGRRRAAAR